MGDAGIQASYNDQPLTVPSAFLGGFKRPVSQTPNVSVMPLALRLLPSTPPPLPKS
jgi:hypothetical protein